MEHPYLYFSADELLELRRRVESGVPAWLYQTLLANCTEYVQSLDPSANDWDRVEGIVHAHAVIRPLVELSLAWAISENAQYADTARSILRRICPWETWFAGYEPTRALIISAAARALDWLHPLLSDAERATVTDKIVTETRLLRQNAPETFPPTRHDSGPPRCLAPLGIAGLLLRDEIDEASEWVRTAREGARTWIEHAFDDDGAPYYSSDNCYSTIAMSDLLTLVFALRHSGDTELADHPAFTRTALYPLYRMEPQRDGYGQFCVYYRMPLAISHTIGLATLTSDGLAQWHYLHTQGPDGLAHRGQTWGGRNGRDDLAMGLLWYRDVEVESPDASTRLSLGKCFMPSGKLVMRSGFEATTDTYLAMECGPARQGWSQADCGSFVLDAGGERFVDDPGVGGGIDYSGSAGAHNVVLVDGRGPALRGSGQVRTFLHTSFADYALADQTPAYGDAVERAHRHVVYIRPDVFVIIDDLLCREPVQSQELLLHVDEEHLAIQQDSESRFTIPGTGADLAIVFAEPSKAERVAPGTTDATGVMYAEHSLHRQVVDVGDRSLLRWYSFFPAARRLEDKERALFITLFSPTAHGAPAPTIDTVREDGATGFDIGSACRCLYRPSPADGPIAGCTTDALLVLRGEEEGEPRILAAGCTHVQGPGIPGVSSTTPFTAIMGPGGGRIGIETAASVEIDGPQGKRTVSLPAGSHELVFER